MLMFLSSSSASCPNAPAAFAMLNGGTETVKKKAHPDRMEYAVCVWHFLVTVASIGLVCFIFDGDMPHQTDAYVMAPSGGCIQWGNGECIVQENAGNTAKLWGLLHMDERKAVGLFSSTNPAVVCLTSQIIFACLTAAHAPLRSDTARWSMMVFSFIVMGAYAVALLFLQSKWQIPGNNLLWMEVTLVVSMMANLAESPDASDLPRIIGSVFSVPMLCVASLVAAGEANAVSLRISYVGIIGVGVLWLIERISDTDETDRWHAGERSWVLWFTPWLCIIPFITVASLRLQTMAVIPDVQGWSIAALTLVLSWAIFIMMYFTACGINQILSADTQSKKADGQFGANEIMMQEEEVRCAIKTDFIGWFFYVVHQLLHSAVVLLILSGLLINAK